MTKRADEGERAPGRTHAGRAPSLTPRGQAWAVGAACSCSSARSPARWRVAALGVVSLAALGAAYVAFFPTSVLVWRAPLELLWRVERAEDASALRRRPPVPPDGDAAQPRAARRSVARGCARSPRRR